MSAFGARVSASCDRVLGLKEGRRRCQEWDCPDPSTEARRLPAAEGVVWVSGELRTFVSGPGRVELRIARKLERAGLRVALWPNFDAATCCPSRCRGQRT